MKTILIILALFVIGCADVQPIEHRHTKATNLTTFRIGRWETSFYEIPLDGCQYWYGTNTGVITHKGNCTNH